MKYIEWEKPYIIDIATNSNFDPHLDKLDCCMYGIELQPKTKEKVQSLIQEQFLKPAPNLYANEDS